jgi:hypothetical protein
MRIWGRKLVITLATVASLTGLAGCSGSGISSADGYKIGCPAVDTVVAGGSLGSKAAVAALKKLRGQQGMSKQTVEWVDAAIGALETTDPNKMPAHTKTLLVDGCAKNGYPLHNLVR